MRHTYRNSHGTAITQVKSLNSPTEGKSIMRRVKLALVPVIVAAVELFGASAANGYFRVK